MSEIYAIVNKLLSAALKLIMLSAHFLYFQFNLLRKNLQHLFFCVIVLNYYLTTPIEHLRVNIVAL